MRRKNRNPEIKTVLWLIDRQGNDLTVPIIIQRSGPVYRAISINGLRKVSGESFTLDEVRDYISPSTADPVRRDDVCKAMQGDAEN